MTQNRKAPAFQEYAATVLASREFRLMSLAERGLYHTLRLECWENKQVPASLSELVKYLGCDIDEIKNALTENVKSFFIEENGWFTCPELDAYRKHIDKRRDAQSGGGKRGAATRNSKSKTANKPTRLGVVSNLASTPPSSLQAPHEGSCKSLVQSSTEKQSQEQSLDNGINDTWLNDYDEASEKEG